MSGNVSFWILENRMHLLALLVQVVIVVRYVCRLVVRHKARDVSEYIPNTRATPIGLYGTLDLER